MRGNVTAALPFRAPFTVAETNASSDHLQLQSVVKDLLVDWRWTAMDRGHVNAQLLRGLQFATVTARTNYRNR